MSSGLQVTSRPRAHCTKILDYTLGPWNPLTKGLSTARACISLYLSAWRPSPRAASCRGEQSLDLQLQDGSRVGGCGLEADAEAGGQHLLQCISGFITCALVAYSDTTPAGLRSCLLYCWIGVKIQDRIMVSADMVKDGGTASPGKSWLPTWPSLTPPYQGCWDTSL